MPIAIGFLEYTSIGSGLMAADRILKNTSIKVIMANPNCPGKYQILFTGEVSSVTSAVELAEQMADSGFLDSLVLPRVDEKVIQAFFSPAPAKVEDSVGIIETLTITDSIMAADTMVKTAKVEILELRLGKGLAGKSYAMVTGTIQNVKEAVETAASGIKDKGVLISKVVISGIAPELLEFLC